MKDFITDIRNAILAFFAGPVAIAVGAFVLVGSLAYCAGQKNVKQDVKMAALVDTVRIADSAAKARTDTVIIYRAASAKAKAQSDALDSNVVIRDDSSAIVADTVAIVPPEVIADIRGLRLTVATQDTLIHSLYGRDSTQEWRIATRDQMLRELGKQAHPKCGRRCGIVLGLTAGILIHKAAR